MYNCMCVFPVLFLLLLLFPSGVFFVISYVLGMVIEGGVYVPKAYEEILEIRIADYRTSIAG